MASSRSLVNREAGYIDTLVSLLEQFDTDSPAYPALVRSIGLLFDSAWHLYLQELADHLELDPSFSGSATELAQQLDSKLGTISGEISELQELEANGWFRMLIDAVNKGGTGGISGSGLISSDGAPQLTLPLLRENYSRFMELVMRHRETMNEW